MPSLIDFRRRIRSVKRTQQITKAMKMVSAARLRRAQDRVISARPYSNSLLQMLRNVAAAASAEQAERFIPLLEVREEKRILLIVVTSDRGLAGAFNMNVIKEAVRFLQSNSTVEVKIETIGRKGRDFFKRRGKIAGEHIGVVEKATFADAQRISRLIIDRYANAEIDAVYFVGNEFKNVISQRVRVVKLLPISVPEHHEPRQYLIEGDPFDLLNSLLPRYVELLLLRVLLESAAGEHAARMVAMEAASKNASEVIDKLTLRMNRVRQASITTEIIEVVSGAQSAE